MKKILSKNINNNSCCSDQDEQFSESLSNIESKRVSFDTNSLETSNSIGTQRCSSKSIQQQDRQSVNEFSAEFSTQYPTSTTSTSRLEANLNENDIITTESEIVNSPFTKVKRKRSKRKLNPQNSSEKNLRDVSHFNMYNSLNLDKYSFVISKITDPKIQTNHITLARNIRALFPKAVNAFQLPFGDIKVLFDDKEDMLRASNTSIKNIFGLESIISNNSKKHFLAIHGVPVELTSDDIKDELYIATPSICTISLKYSANKYRTVVAGYSNKVEQADTLERGWLYLGYLRLKISMARNKAPTQCFNCQKFHHSCKICPALHPTCRICAENHPSDKCPKHYKKCANCGGKHHSSSNLCPTKVKHQMKKRHPSHTNYNKSTKKTSLINNGTHIHPTNLSVPEKGKTYADITKKLPENKVSMDNIYRLIDQKINEAFSSVIDKMIDRIIEAISSRLGNAQTDRIYKLSNLRL